MLTEEKIQKFLANYNSKDRIHTRVLKMLLESLNKEDVMQIATELTRSSINIENLEILSKSVSSPAVEEPSSFLISPEFDSKISTCLVSSEDKTADLKNLPENGESDNFYNNTPKKVKFSEDSEIPGIHNDSSETETAFPDTGKLNYLDPSFLKTVDKHKNVFLPDPGLRDLQSADSFNTTCIIKDNAYALIRPEKCKNFDENTKNVPKSEPYFNNKHPEIIEDDLERDTVFYKNINKFTEAPQYKPKDPSYLYPLLQCKLCGLRFNKDATEQFGIHIEDHRRKTKALGEKTVLRREFFNLSSINKIEKLELIVEGEIEPLIFNKEMPNCIFCNKIIKKTWDDDLENWILEGGVKINEKEFAHRSCIL